MSYLFCRVREKFVLVRCGKGFFSGDGREGLGLKWIRPLGYREAAVLPPVQLAVQLAVLRAGSGLVWM
jgi:hypothetical protein